MSLNHLETFEILCETLSFSETARKLGVTQPCVSRQVRLLEEQLGARLFIRDRNQVALSPQGKALKLKVLPQFRELKRTLEATREESTSLSGTIGLGSLAEIGQAVFLPLVLRFRKEHPGISINLEYLKEFEILEKIKNGDLDFGVVSTAISTERIRAFEIIKERVVLVTRSTNHKSPASFSAGIPMVNYRSDDPLHGIFLKTAIKGKRGMQADVKISVNSHRSMIEALLSEDLHAVMPFHSAEPDLRSGRLRIVPGPELNQSLYLIHLDNSLMERRCESFKQFLLKELKALRERK